MTQSIFARELQPCILARLACPNCGPVRMALPQTHEPVITLICPYCDSDAPAEALGTVQTVRELPFFHYEGEPIAARQLPQVGSFARLQPGQILVYCEEQDILHLAALAGIYTSRAHLGPNGVPSISFIRSGEETGPVPHVSACGGVPPYWCLPSEAREAMNPPEKVPCGTNAPKQRGETKTKTNQKRQRAIKSRE